MTESRANRADKRRAAPGRHDDRIAGGRADRDRTLVSGDRGGHRRGGRRAMARAPLDLHRGCQHGRGLGPQSLSHPRALRSRRPGRGCWGRRRRGMARCSDCSWRCVLAAQSRRFRACALCGQASAPPTLWRAGCRRYERVRVPVREIARDGGTLVAIRAVTGARGAPYPARPGSAGGTTAARHAGVAAAPTRRGGADAGGRARARRAHGAARWRRAAIEVGRSRPAAENRSLGAWRRSRDGASRGWRCCGEDESVRPRGSTWPTTAPRSMDGRTQPRPAHGPGRARRKRLAFVLGKP